MKVLIAALATLLLVACGALWWEHRTATGLAGELDTAKTAALSADFEASAARADLVTVTKFVDRVQVVRETTATIRQEIPRYVTPAADRRYLLPDGFVWLHDAAAAGVSPGQRAGDPDAASEAVTASQALDVVVRNYGICHETAEQLTSLQEWVRSHHPGGSTSP
ncbi:hypothetical protein ACQKIE_18730 [Luteibacter sp. NPDC031894]|uniref:hypothetical protein n=1 Tax=Luteibacter sp. NPDC031894 TaxID=3390572 RepID=UPI003D02A8CB